MNQKQQSDIDLHIVHINTRQIILYGLENARVIGAMPERKHLFLWEVFP